MQAVLRRHSETLVRGLEVMRIFDILKAHGCCGRNYLTGMVRRDHRVLHKITAYLGRCMSDCNSCHFGWLAGS